MLKASILDHGGCEQSTSCSNGIVSEVCPCGNPVDNPVKLMGEPNQDPAINLTVVTGSLETPSTSMRAQSPTKSSVLSCLQHTSKAGFGFKKESLDKHCVYASLTLGRVGLFRAMLGSRVGKPYPDLCQLVLTMYCLWHVVGLGRRRFATHSMNTQSGAHP